MTKKLFLLTSYFILLTSYCYPQQPGYEPHDIKTEKQYKWGIGLQVNTIDEYFPYGNSILGIYEPIFELSDSKNKSFSSGLFGTYSLNDYLSIQLKAGITSIKIISHSDTRNQYTGPVPCSDCHVGDATISQKRYYFSPRILWYKNEKHFGFYGGLQVTYINYSDYIYEVTYTQYDTTYTKILYTTQDKIKVPGGFSFGPGTFIGFDFYLLKHFSLGAEFSSDLFYSKFSGKVEHTGNQIYPIAQAFDPDYYTFSKKGFDFSKAIISFNIEYLFFK